MNNDVIDADLNLLSNEQQLRHRIESLQQENIVLKSEVETCKLKIRSLQEENLQLRKNSVNIQVRAEQEEEYISNKLLKKITELKKEKETLALNYEQEEEFLTNDLTRKLSQLRDEKATLEKTLEKEQEAQISKLMSRIQKLENDVVFKQKNLDTLRREKIELENALEQEQEGLVNRLWKKMEKLEAEKRVLQSKLDVSLSPMLSATYSELPKNYEMDTSDGHPVVTAQNNQCSEQEIDSVLSSMEVENDGTSLIHSYIGRLRQEVARLREIVKSTNTECSDKLRNLEREEKVLQDENRRLRKRLQAEIERRQDICRNLSESESSLEVDEERQFNEIRRKGVTNDLSSKNRMRTTSDSSSIYSRSQVYSADYTQIKQMKDEKVMSRRSTGSNVTQFKSNLSLENPNFQSAETHNCEISDSSYKPEQMAISGQSDVE